jgi:hypothetical protein
LSSNADLANYWDSYFMPIPPWTDGNWFIEIWKRFLVDPVGLPSIFITTVVLSIGVYSALVKKWQYALVFLIPFPVILLASGIRKYPFGGRLLLFIVPIIFLLIGVGIKQILVWLQKINPWIGPVIAAILVLFFIYQPVLNALQIVQTPIMREHIKPILSTLSENKQDLDSIYVYYGAEPALRYYAPLYGLSRSNYIVGVVSRSKPNLYKQDIDKLRGNKRVWIVFSHNCYFFPCKVNEEEFILQYLDMIGAKLLEIKQPGSSLYLYDLSLKNPIG